MLYMQENWERTGFLLPDVTPPRRIGDKEFKKKLPARRASKRP
jgi:hypothetical protein